MENLRTWPKNDMFFFPSTCFFFEDDGFYFLFWWNFGEVRFGLGWIVWVSSKWNSTGEPRQWSMVPSGASSEVEGPNVDYPLIPPHKPIVYTPHWNLIWTSLNYLWHRTGNSFSKSIQAAVGYGGTISWAWRPKQIGGKWWKKKGRQWYDFQRLSQIDDFQIHQGVSSRKIWCSRFEALVCFRRIFFVWRHIFPDMTADDPPSHGFCRGFSRWNVWGDDFFAFFFVWTFREFLIWSKSMGIDLMVPPQWHLGTKKRGLIKE